MKTSSGRTAHQNQVAPVAPFATIAFDVPAFALMSIEDLKATLVRARATQREFYVRR